MKGDYVGSQEGHDDENGGRLIPAVVVSGGDVRDD